MGKNDEFTSVEIPKQLYEEIAKRVDNTEFNSVSEYVSFVLEEVIKEEEEEDISFTKEDEEKVRERLQALGYLD